MRLRFEGEICGFGTISGHRMVIGNWARSPFGPVTDVMIEAPDGRRLLLAPTEEVAEFIVATYRFDDVEIAPVTSDRVPGHLRVDAGDRLAAHVVAGRRTAIGTAMRLVPRRVATSPLWATAVDPVARAVLPGVRTRGTAGNGRREWYGAWDVHRVTGVSAFFNGEPLGSLTDVVPPVRFGFGSTPRRPAIVSLTTTIETSSPANG